MRNQLFLGAAVAALMIPAAASAQETTSQIRGSVTDESGNPVGGARVTITHTPSGTRSTVTSNADGQFQVSGVRVGGPFTVEVMQAGKDVATITDIYTVIGQPYDVPVVLTSSQDIVVTASKVRNSGTRSLGPQTLLTARDIAKVASVNRDVRDLARRDPFATLDLANNRAVSFAGVNPRFNAFTINGVRVNDRFGLNADANPTRRGPVPLDAIDQFTVSLSPVDVRQGNFTGGAIDVVLRPGTNKFEGTGFWSINTDGLSGDRIGTTTTINSFNSQTYGGRLSGPIIKDKLFFMVAAERTTQGLPNPNGIAGEGFANAAQGLTRAQITQIQQIAQQVYNYNPGDLVRNQTEIDEKIVGRIDWNITDGQRAFFTFTNAYDSLIIPQGNSVNPQSPSVGLASNAYVLTELQRSGQLQLNSDWTDNFSTEARIGYLSFLRGQDPLQGRGFGQFSVCLDPNATTNAAGTANTSNATVCTPTSPRIFFGPDPSRQTNALFSDAYSGSLLARLNLGQHSLKLLFEFEEYRVRNAFVQNSAGTWFFDTIADFQNRNAATFTYQNALSGNLEDAVANFKTRTWTFGIQDTWKVTPNFTIDYGMRYDLYDQNGAIPLNNNLLARSGIANTATLAGRGLFQPRIGFQWKPTPRLSVRGTAGVYGGGNPAVYFSNSYSVTGVITNTVNILRNNTLGGVPPFQNNVPANVGTAALTGVDGRTINPAIQQFLATNTGAIAGSPTALVDPRFEVPATSRATISLDYTANLGPLGDGWHFGFDYLYAKPFQQIVFTDLRSNRTGLLTPDGRPRYNVNVGLQPAGSVNTDILMTNSNVGRSHIYVIRFDKRFNFGLSFGGSYTLQDVTDAGPSTSSVAASNYQNAAFRDPNFQAAGISNDETTWQFKYNIGFDRAFFGDYRTIIQLFGESRAGRRFSYTMQDPSAGRGPVFGTVGNLANQLLYVPLAGNDPIVSYDSAATQTTLDGIINGSVLRNFRGQTAPRNIGRSRAFTRIDLHLEQEIPTFVGKSRISLFADIENLPNLLNSDWGGLRQQGFPYNAAVVNVSCLNVPVATGTAATAAQTSTITQPCAQYRFSTARAPNDAAFGNPVLGTSLYTIRIGARVTF
ncbi:carboxypeptidase regulatory-like domain-containing protein [Sphingomonas sp.]|uniref:TonB-dependent receptor n=1 Tax=Sphingomonas sp. TaxID=28214 RepID=UPI001D363070|nr:carboxypeptidase regulatory-like domain-containing protein [Sphingomonas sp.]MBX9797212.1 TonB-dependent receptor [Sphingomonas sp.]